MSEPGALFVNVVGVLRNVSRNDALGLSLSTESLLPLRSRSTSHDAAPEVHLGEYVKDKSAATVFRFNP